MSVLEQYLEIVKPAVRAIKAYHLQERRYEVKLNQNESPFDLPQPLKEAILEKFKEKPWNRYPTFGNVNLVRKLAAHLSVTPEQVLVGNGSNELLQTLVNVTLFEGRRILLVKPTFLIYEQLARVAGAEVLALEFNADWSFPVETILRTVSKSKIDLCILCSPNSPTGVELAKSDLQRILAATQGLVLLDEAYHEFSEFNHLALLGDHANLLITRTFSKAMGLAGLRIGYLVGHPALVEQVNKAKLPYNLDLFSELVAETLLENIDFIERNIRTITQEKARLLKRIAEIKSMRVFPSAANFLMLQVPDAKQIFEALLNHGVLVRDISGYHPRLKNMLRLSVGTRQENDRLFDALVKSLQS